jgi:hypothetical protein
MVDEEIPLPPDEGGPQSNMVQRDFNQRSPSIHPTSVYALAAGGSNARWGNP